MTVRGTSMPSGVETTAEPSGDMTPPSAFGQARTNAPANVGAGGALAYDGVRYIYAFRGNNQTAFWRYDTTNNSWATRTAAPNGVGAGGSLAYDGSRYIYAFRGNNRVTFWRYDTTANSWATRTAAPDRVGAGGALAYDGSRYIYAFRGQQPDSLLAGMTLPTTHGQ